MSSTPEFPSAVAKARFVRVSPRKARRVIDLVRGRSCSDALDILRWAPQAASEPVAKVIASAAANAQNNNGLDPATLVVATVYADEDPHAKASGSHQAARRTPRRGQQARRESPGKEAPGQEGAGQQGSRQEGARQ